MENPTTCKRADLSASLRRPLPTSTTRSWLAAASDEEDSTSPPSPTQAPSSPTRATASGARGSAWLHEQPRPIARHVLEGPGVRPPHHATKNSNMVNAIIAATQGNSAAVARTAARHGCERPATTGPRHAASDAPLPSRLRVNGMAIAPNDFTSSGMEREYATMLSQQRQPSDSTAARALENSVAAAALLKECEQSSHGDSRSPPLLPGAGQVMAERRLRDASQRGEAVDGNEEHSGMDETGKTSTQRGAVYASLPTGRHATHTATFAMRTLASHASYQGCTRAQEAISIDARARQMRLQKKLEQEAQKKYHRLSRQAALDAARKDYLASGPSQAFQRDQARDLREKEKKVAALLQHSGASDIWRRGPRYVLYSTYLILVNLIYQLHIDPTGFVVTLPANETYSKAMNDLVLIENDMFIVYACMSFGLVCGITAIGLQGILLNKKHLDGCFNKTKLPAENPVLYTMPSARFVYTCMYISFCTTLFGFWAQMAGVYVPFAEETAYELSQTDLAAGSWGVFFWLLISLILHICWPVVAILQLAEGKMLVHSTLPKMFGIARSQVIIGQTQVCLLFFDGVAASIGLVLVYRELGLYFKKLGISQTSGEDEIMYIFYARVIVGICVCVGIYIMVFITALKVFVHGRYEALRFKRTERAENILFVTRATIREGAKARIVHSVYRPELNNRICTIQQDLFECRVNLDNMAIVNVQLADEGGRTVALEEFQLRPDCEPEQQLVLQDKAELGVLKYDQQVYNLKGRIEWLARLGTLYMQLLSTTLIAVLFMTTIDQPLLTQSVLVPLFHVAVPTCDVNQTERCIMPGLTPESDHFKVPVTNPTERMDLQRSLCPLWTQCIVEDGVVQDVQSSICGTCEIHSDTLQPPGYVATKNPRFLEEGSGAVAAVIIWMVVGAIVGLLLAGIVNCCMGLSSFEGRSAGDSDSKNRVRVRPSGCTAYVTYIFFAIMFSIVGLGVAPWRAALSKPGFLDPAGNSIDKDSSSFEDSTICEATDPVLGPGGAYGGISNLCLFEVGYEELKKLIFGLDTLLFFGLVLCALFLLFDIWSTQETITIAAKGRNAWTQQLSSLYVVYSVFIYAPAAGVIVFLLWDGKYAEEWRDKFDGIYEDIVQHVAVTAKGVETFLNSVSANEKWFDGRAAMNVMLRPLSQEHVIFLACVASVTVLGCLAGRCLVMSAPTDALTEERDSDSTRCITGVRVILFCGVVINFFPDLMIVTENLWSISLLNNAFACITIVRILLGGFFIHSCALSDVLPITEFILFRGLYRVVFCIVVFLIPFLSATLLCISWTAADLAQKTYQERNAIAIVDASVVLDELYNVTYAGDVSIFITFNISYTLASDDPYYWYPWIPPTFYASVIITYIYTAAFGFVVVYRLAANMSEGRDVVWNKLADVCCDCCIFEAPYLIERDENEGPEPTKGQRGPDSSHDEHEVPTPAGVGAKSGLDGGENRNDAKVVLKEGVYRVEP